MTLNEAIAHARKVAENNIRDSKYTKISNNKQMNDKYVLGCIECAKEHEQLAEWLEELKEYRTIGTQDEFRSAIEKQKERKTIKYDKKALWDYACPKCGEPLIKTNYEYKYCDMCGQKLDWGDENDD